MTAEDVVDVFETATFLTLRGQGKISMTELIKNIDSVCSIKDTSFQNFVEESHFGTREDIIETIDLVLAPPSVHRTKGSENTKGLV